MQAFALQLALVAGVLATFFFGPGTAIAFLWIRKKRRRAQRRSPIGIDLLRGPGHTVREQLEEASNDMTWDLVVLCAIPLVFLSLYLAQARAGLLGEGHNEIIYSVATVGVVAWMIRKLVRAGGRLDNLRNGFDAELAVGQELDQLMKSGAAVFHDFPAEGFNIDHVVISRQGVFAVETKGYTKPIDDKGKVSYKVAYDGQTLRFPHWTTSEPIEQAERQAKWLSKWATSAVGGMVVATPVLALPGWFVEQKGRSVVRVFSGKALKTLLDSAGEQPLSTEDVQRVVHQVEVQDRGADLSTKPSLDVRYSTILNCPFG